MPRDASPVLHTAEMHLLIRGFVKSGTHRHEHDEVLLLVAGRYHGWVGDRELRLEPGQALWYPAGVTHQPLETTHGTDARLLYAAFRCSSTWRLGDDDATVVVDHRGRLQSTLWWLSELVMRRDPTATAQADRLLAVLLEEFRGLAAADCGDDRFQALLAFIQGQLAAALTVDEMARFLGLGRRQLERMFQQRCGCSPKAWLRRCRLEKALHLRACGQTLSEIAPQVGIRSVPHLSRLLGGAAQRRQR